MTDSEDSASARVEGCSQEEWERLVDSSCRATFFHTHAWNSFLQDYGEATSLFRPRHIFERDDAGRLVGIFPLYVTPRRDAKSLPCGDYGGPLVEDGEAGRRAMPRLLRRAASIPGLRIWKLVVEGIPGELQAAYEGLGYRVRVAHRTYILDLAGRSLESVESGFRRDARRAFRKAAETSATIRGFKTGSGWVKPYYELYLETMTKLGSHPRQIRFFELIDVLLGQLGEHGACLKMAYLDGQPVAGIISFIHRDTMHIFSNVSSQESAASHVNDLLYKDVIEYAVERKLGKIDFGLSPLDPASGLCLFKEKWGTRSEPLYSATKRSRIATLSAVTGRLRRLG